MGAIVTALFAPFIILLPRYMGTAITLFALLILTSLVYLILHPTQVKRTNSIERFFFISMLANYLWMAFIFYYNGEPDRGANFLWERHFFFLFLIPMFFLFRQIRMPTHIFLICLVASALLSFSDILLDLYQGVNPGDGGINPNNSGPIQLCVTGNLACYLPDLNHPREKVIVVLGILAVLATVLLSQSKVIRAAVLTLCMNDQPSFFNRNTPCLC